MFRCRFEGPFGGTGGDPFNELYDDCGAVVKRIVIYRDALIVSIEITYRLSDGREVTGAKHGGDHGNRVVIDINIHDGERIIGIWGRTDRKIDRLGFITNHGRIFGPYGGSHGGDYFKVEACNLRGISGRSGNLVDSIGFYCSPISSVPCPTK